MQVVDRVRVLLSEDRDQHIGAGDLLLAVRGGLHVHDRPLDHALKAQCGLRIDFLGARHDRGIFANEITQVLTQIVDVGRTGAKHLRRRRVVQQGQQQVLDRNELVALLTRLDEGHVKADFQLLRDHASSITHCNGCWCSREYPLTCSTLLAATSRG